MNILDSDRKAYVPYRLELPVHSAVELNHRTAGSEPNPASTDTSESPTSPSPEDRGGPSAGGDDRSDGESDSAKPAPLPLDQVFEILKNSRRRQTLHYLHENGGEATLSDLAEHIAALENDTTVDAISSSQRKRVYVGLYQCHLPKMNDMSIVDFDKNRGTIELAENASQLTPYLDSSDTPTWHRLYGAVTAVGVGLFVLSVVGSAPFGLTPATVLAALLAVMGICSGLHAYVQSRDDSEGAVDRLAPTN